MSARSTTAAPPGLFRASSRDAVFLGLALAQGAGLGVLAAAARAPSSLLVAALLVAVALWWNSNTISHNHLHSPIFRRKGWNRAFSLYLTMLLGVPQSLWRARHLWHHAGEPACRSRPPAGPMLPLEIGLIAALWLGLLASAPVFFLGAYLPGYLLGLILCQLQGHYEHAAAASGVSHYGWLYNRLFFNDGYHAEHHRRPGEHWSLLPLHRLEAAPRSALPAVLRLLPAVPSALGGFANRCQARLLVALELLPLRSALVRSFMLRSHRRAFAALLQGAALPAAPRIVIVGGGLFPRTLLVLHRLLPTASLTVVDESAAHIACARACLAGDPAAPAGVRFLAERYDPLRHDCCDLLVVPLGYVGDRGALYRCPAPGGPVVVIHDWLWRRRGLGVRISWLLLKRLNLIDHSASRVANGA